MYTILAAAIAHLPNVQLDRKPRMADFGKWIAATEPALPWPEGTFAALYEENRANANNIAMESSIVTKPLLTLMNNVDCWEGNATELLEKLNNLVSDRLRQTKAWPKAPNALSGALRRLAPNLRQVGIHVEFFHSGDRTITLRKEPKNGGPESSEKPAAESDDTIIGKV